MKPINLREADFKREVFQFTFPKQVLQEFFEYWTEPNPSNTKMRFELEKTWHLGRRVARWARNSKVVIQKQVMNGVKKEPVTPVEKLDAFIDRFRAPGSDIKFSEFCQWYDFMKAEKLLKPMFQKDVALLRELYGKDDEKCRCAVVMDTLTGYVNNGLKVSDILKMRDNVAIQK